MLTETNICSVSNFLEWTLVAMSAVVRGNVPDCQMFADVMMNPNRC